MQLADGSFEKGFHYVKKSFERRRGGVVVTECWLPPRRFDK